MLTEKVETTKKSVDWFLNKKSVNQVIIILMIIIAYLGWQYFVNLEDLKEKVFVLELKDKEKDSIINLQNLEILKLQYNSISTADYDKDDPNPRWIVDAKTHIIQWINPAYEEKYLREKGFYAIDLLGTDGRHIFGDVVDDWIANNKLVIRLNRPLTVDNEYYKTTKHPIRRNGKVYAIGGSESRDYN